MCKICAYEEPKRWLVLSHFQRDHADKDFNKDDFEKEEISTIGNGKSISKINRKPKVSSTAKRNKKSGTEMSSDSEMEENIDPGNKLFERLL